MQLLGIQPHGFMTVTESDTPVDCLKLKNIRLETIHKLDNTIGKKLILVINVNLFSKQTITTKEVGLHFTMEKSTELNGGSLQIRLFQESTVFGNFYQIPVVL
jgi:hypothetical protein